MVISNARGGQTTSVRVTPGWNVGRLYPKSESSLVVPLTAGDTAWRTASRRFPDAPQLREMLRGGAGLVCASSYTVRIPAGVAP